jgi:hypothetical protein
MTGQVRIHTNRAFDESSSTNQVRTGRMGVAIVDAALGRGHVFLVRLHPDAVSSAPATRRTSATKSP